MAALTLEAWRDRTLEQVHFAAQAALNAGGVQGQPRLREWVAATATGDLHQCLAQGPHIDALRRTAIPCAMRRRASMWGPCAAWHTGWPCAAPPPLGSRPPRTSR